MEKPIQSPGCWGSPLAHGNNKVPCNSCPYETNCGQEADRIGIALRTKYGLSFSTRKKKTLTASQEAVVKTPQRKVKMNHMDALRAVVSSHDINLTDSLKVGVNPFIKKGPTFMRIIFQHLIDAKSYGKSDLTFKLQNQFGWTEGVARKQLETATSLLIHEGLVNDDGEKVTCIFG